MAENLNMSGESMQNATTITTTEFLKWTETAEKDALYADLFQRNDSNALSGKNWPKRSFLEIFTQIMSFLVPIVTIVSLLLAFHVFIRGQEDNSFAENYPFLCKYFHYDINASDEDKACKTAKLIEDDFNSRFQILEKNIVNQLSIFIPIKVSAALGASNSEARFIREVFDAKNDYNSIISQFEKIKQSSQSIGRTNIICKNMIISGNDTLSVQCDVYGGNIGDTDMDAGSLGSSRIEAVRFLEKLAKTQDSQFIMQNPPATLPVTSTESIENIPSIFKTKTTINISLKYIPFEQKI